MSTLGQNVILPGDLMDDAQSKPTTSRDLRHRQYAIPAPLSRYEIRSILFSAFHIEGITIKRGTTFRQVIRDLPWGAIASTLSWEFRDNLDDVIDSYIF